MAIAARTHVLTLALVLCCKTDVSTITMGNGQWVEFCNGNKSVGVGLISVDLASRPTIVTISLSVFLALMGDKVAQKVIVFYHMRNAFKLRRFASREIQTGVSFYGAL
jgi:hypothetical protein